MNKPRLYFVRYPKLGRGFWRVSPMPHRSTKTLDRWTYAHALAREMNRQLEARGNPRP